ncbi:2-dehydro-3-deoxygalactonokinase [Vallitalea pronyensis]|uniref:2-dehydro-3-deoxygalactonokinase n=1 Tax=Vallitalea pronyensis TaxID=1348613 RepID=A0A8J8MKH1_9FIRM|nr:2-dehydro-3-deoxygalactonokinase [Vallitalea pronyensis]QUI23181.1 2-dehydro-3-deoxygalactonokinase [Vallitalea pronyensis]
MIGIIDCGNTGLTFYLVDKNDAILSKSRVNVGVTQTAKDGHNGRLKAGILKAFASVLGESGVAKEDVEVIVAYGMITSEMGILEVPHIVAPVSMKALADHVVVVKDESLFPIDIPLILIPGIKNPFEHSSIENIGKADLMRGEEAQAAGVLYTYDLEYPINILELGSTTKFISIDKQGRIAGSITSMSGQVYGAVIQETFIGKCVKRQDDTEHYFSETIFNTAFNCVENGGLLRTLLLTRFSEIVLPSTWFEREFFVSSAIAADDVNVFKEAEKTMGFDVSADYVMIGTEDRCALYAYLLKNKLNHRGAITKITDKREIDMLGIQGAIAISKEVSKNFL